MANILQLKRSTAAVWTSINPILGQGEPGWEIDTKKLKVGDGISNWNSLLYFLTVPTLSANYVHTQGVAANTWTIAHNLGYYPNITVFDSTDRSILTQIEHININNAVVHNDAAFAGKAYCS